MGKKYFFSFIIFVILSSCINNLSKRSDIEQPRLDTLNIEVSETEMISRADSIDLTKVSRLSERDYIDMQLSKVKDLEGYDVSDLSKGRTLFSDENGKIITVLIITDGEITEYLLSYDKEGKLQDNLLVAYEDMVEYYTKVSSKINSREIVVETINFTYGLDESDQSEKSDTSYAKYQITPEFRFVVN